MKIIVRSLNLKYQKFFPLSTAEIYYSESTNLYIKDYDVILFTQFRDKINNRLKEYLTLFVDLNMSKEQILNSFKDGTKYEITRCEKTDFLVFKINATPTVQDVEDFMVFYSQFHQGKKLADTKANCSFYMETLSRFKDHNALVITSAATCDQQTLCTHTYLVDGVRARLINSASVFRDAESGFRALVGRANRCLHWRDMIYFKEQGYRIYDLGGLSADAVNTVSKFKRSFGGEPVTEYYGFYKPLTFKGRLALWLEAIAGGFLFRCG